jgi:hypothetical protein
MLASLAIGGTARQGGSAIRGGPGPAGAVRRRPPAAPGGRVRRGRGPGAPRNGAGRVGGRLAARSALSVADALSYIRKGRGSRGKPLIGWDSLTPAERDVIALVVEGLTRSASASSSRDARFSTIWRTSSPSSVSPRAHSSCVRRCAAATARRAPTETLATRADAPARAATRETCGSEVLRVTPAQNGPSSRPSADGTSRPVSERR